MISILDLHHLCCRLLHVYDLSRCPETWQQEPDGVPLDMLLSGECLSHGDQSESLPGSKKDACS